MSSLAGPPVDEGSALGQWPSQGSFQGPGQESAQGPGHLQAAELVRLIGQSAAAGVDRSALVLRLSCLTRTRGRAHHVRLARAALDPVALADRARSFQLPSEDVVVVWRGSAEAAVDAARQALRQLFADDEAVEPDTLIVRYALPADADRLLRVIEAAMLCPATEAAEIGRAVGRPAAGRPLDLAGLADLEALLAHADLARFARRRPISRLMPDGRFALAWEKRFLSISELTDCVMPDRALRAEPWLFRRLTRTLDRRVLAMLAAPGELDGARPFSLDLNVASLLSRDFLRFDLALPEALRGSVGLDLLLVDALADPAAFLFARDFARVRGYRLALRGLDLPSLQALQGDALAVDALHVRWSAQTGQTEEAWGQADPARIILQSDDPAAVGWGRNRGIRLFAGACTRP